jgi:hypothetical protein
MVKEKKIAENNASSWVEIASHNFLV